MRYLRNREDGWIFEWDPILAANPKCMEVTEQEAYPERFVPVEQAPLIRIEQVVGRTPRVSRKNDVAPVVLETEDDAIDRALEGLTAGDIDVNRDASRRLPK